jgi:hypothetical protein
MLCDAHIYGSVATLNVLGDGDCRCMVCGRCGHHTGNSSQGHYWAFCKVTRGIREFHFCCPDGVHGCELEVIA